MNVVAYHFWSPTCAPCKVIKPAIEDLKEEFEQVKWISVNTHDDTMNYASSFNVSVVPTILVTLQDSSGTVHHMEKHSGTTMSHYYRILRSVIRLRK